MQKSLKVYKMFHTIYGEGPMTRTEVLMSISHWRGRNTHNKESVQFQEWIQKWRE
jgi:hypothetical protein